MAKRAGSVVVVSVVAMLWLSAGPPLFGQGGVAEERGSTETAFSEREGMNVAQQARLAFGAGDRKLAQAEKIDEKIAAESDEKKRQKLLEKQAKAYESAVESFREGLAYEPENVAGWAGLGSAYRQLGKHQEALLAHAEGMKRDGSDDANFEGWTLALMDGSMFGNATAAHAQLAADDAGRAARMLAVMESWLAGRQADPGGIAEADLDRLAQWIAAQKQ